MFSPKTRHIAATRAAGRRLATSVHQVPLILRIPAILLVSIAIILVLLFSAIRCIVRAGARILKTAAGALHTRYRAFLHRHVENVGLIGGLAVTFGLSYALFLLDPRTPSMSIATLQVIVLAPFLFFVALHTAVWTYKHLLPEQFRAFIGQLGDKINGSTLPPLEELLPTNKLEPWNAPSPLQIAQFQLTYHNSNFLRKCVRYVLFALPLFVFFQAMQSMLHLVLSLQPH